MTLNINQHLKQSASNSPGYYVQLSKRQQLCTIVGARSMSGIFMVIAIIIKVNADTALPASTYYHRLSRMCSHASCSHHITTGICILGLGQNS